MPKINIVKAIVAGVVGTVALTVVATVGAPMMGLPKMDIPGMLASTMGGSIALGWAAHFMVGTVLAIGYALVQSKLPGPVIIKGALYGLAPWLVAQVMVMPLMGLGLFSGSLALAGGSLIGHLIYGAVVGLVYGGTSSAEACSSESSSSCGCCH